MALKPMAATSGRSTKPTTSTLNMIVEDVDCSGFAATPEDGQFVLAPGSTASHNPANLQNDDIALVLATQGAGLRMVWSSANRADRQALGQTRVPIIRKGGGRFRTKCFAIDTNVNSLSEYGEGTLLTVAEPDAANPLQGSSDRLLLCPVGATGAPSGDFQWVVGYVVRVITDSLVSGTGEIEFYLYDQPRLQQVAL